MSSRLERAASGRAVRAVVTAPDVGLDVGAVFVVLGDSLLVGEAGFAFTGAPSGRPALPAETPRRNGTIARRGTPPRKWTDEDRALAVDLVAGGLSWSQAAAEIGCTKASVGEWVRRANQCPIRAQTSANTVTERSDADRGTRLVS